MQLIEPKLEHFCDLSVELGSIQEMGMGRAGKRRIIPIVGGIVSGPSHSGQNPQSRGRLANDIQR